MVCYSTQRMATTTVVLARETRRRRTRAARYLPRTTPRRSATARPSSDSDRHRALHRRAPRQTRMTLAFVALVSTRPSKSCMRSSPARRAPLRATTRVTPQATRTLRAPAATRRITPTQVGTLQAQADTPPARLLGATLRPRLTTPPPRQLQPRQLQRVHRCRRTRTRQIQRSSTRRTLRQTRRRRTCRPRSRGTHRTRRQLQPQCSANKCRRSHLRPMAPRRRKCTRR